MEWVAPPPTSGAAYSRTDPSATGRPASTTKSPSSPSPGSAAASEREDWPPVQPAPDLGRPTRPAPASRSLLPAFAGIGGGSPIWGHKGSSSHLSPVQKLARNKDDVAVSGPRLLRCVRCGQLGFNDSIVGLRDELRDR